MSEFGNVLPDTKRLGAAASPSAGVETLPAINPMSSGGRRTQCGYRFCFAHAFAFFFLAA
ncbi:MAG TPA: hypothetical protein VN685_12330 [Rhizomicrobium sp.]|nr:hypothetical protein [Rhizomicrobium sp.]